MQRACRSEEFAALLLFVAVAAANRLGESSTAYFGPPLLGMQKNSYGISQRRRDTSGRQEMDEQRK